MTVKKRRAVLRVILFIAVLAIAAMIYAFSAQDAEESSQVSSSVTQFIIRLLAPNFSSMTRAEKKAFLASLSLFVRKAAHFSEYALFAGVLMHYLRLRLKSGRVSLACFLSWVIATAYAGTDEVHQMFVNGRAAAIADVCIDSAGALTGVLIAAAMLALHLRRKARS